MHVIIFNLLIVIPRFYAMSDLMFGLPSAFFWHYNIYNLLSKRFSKTDCFK